MSDYSDGQNLIQESLKVNITYLLSNIEDAIYEMEREGDEDEDVLEDEDFLSQAHYELSELEKRAKPFKVKIEGIGKVKKLLKLYSEGE